MLKYTATAPSNYLLPSSTAFPTSTQILARTHNSRYPTQDGEPREPNIPLLW